MELVVIESPRVAEAPPTPPAPPKRVTPPKPIATPMPKVEERREPVREPEPTPARAPEPAPVAAPTRVTSPPAAAVTPPSAAPAPPTSARAMEPGVSWVDSNAPARTPGAVASIPRDSAITRVARPTGGYQVRPTYPSTAKRLGVQGTTLLRVHVLEDGRVGVVDVEETAGHPDLDQAAADAVRRWRFEPARRGEQAVAMWVHLPVEFRLK